MRMYGEGPRQLIEGWSKNLAAGAGTVPPVRLAFVVAWIAASAQACVIGVNALLGAGTVPFAGRGRLLRDCSRPTAWFAGQIGTRPPGWCCWRSRARRGVRGSLRAGPLQDARSAVGGVAGSPLRPWFGSMIGLVFVDTFGLVRVVVGREHDLAHAPAGLLRPRHVGHQTTALGEGRAPLRGTMHPPVEGRAPGVRRVRRRPFEAHARRIRSGRACRFRTGNTAAPNTSTGRLRALVLYTLWNPPLLTAAMLGYAVAANIPFIAIQRYNRLRILRIQRRRARNAS